MADPLTADRSSHPLRLDPRTYQRGLSCVHCGLCLPACPTYTQTGLEAEGPRGRIQLMLALSDAAIEPTRSVRRHLELCLDCRACETACPSGVVYHELIEETRLHLGSAGAGKRPVEGESRLLRWLFFNVFTRPGRLKLALLPARLMQKLGIDRLLRARGLVDALPPRLAKMQQMLPRTGSLWPARLPAMTRADAGTPAKAKIAFFTGCIGSVLFDRVNRQSVELLARCGADVVVPSRQVCCGAIHHHNGDPASARDMARRNIDAFSSAADAIGGIDFIVSAVAGCGAMLRDYAVLLRDDPAYAQRAADFAARARDVTQALDALGLPATLHPVPGAVAYHDACHLAHAQGVTAAPRRLLGAIPGLTLAPLAEADMCCGAAGTYNLTEPEMSAALARRKLDCIQAAGAPVCAAANAGCILQIQAQADAEGIPLRVVHPVELLHQAVFGPR